MSDTVETIKASTTALNVLSRRGLSLHQAEDPRYIEMLMANTEKSYLTASLNFRANDFTRSNCLWIYLCDEDEQVCGIAGLRTDDIPRGGWIPFWAHHYERTSPVGTGKIDTAVFPPIVEEISGRCAYIGDLWLRSQSRVDIPAFAITLQALAVTAVNADWVYSFVRHQHAMRGQAQNFRLNRTYPSVHRWVSEPAPHRHDSDWLLCSNRADIAYTMRTYARYEHPAEDPETGELDPSALLNFSRNTATG